MILIRHKETGEERAVRDGERYSSKEWQPIRPLPNQKEYPKMTMEQRIGFGDIAAKILKTIGFKDYWKEKNDGDCKPCEERQAILNYLNFKGPQWLEEWVASEKLKEKESE